MYTILALLPCLATVLACLAMLACLPGMWARLEAPYSPDATPAEAQAWADALDASLETAAEHAEVVLRRHGVVACPWAMPPALAALLASAIPVRIAASPMPLN